MDQAYNSMIAVPSASPYHAAITKTHDDLYYWVRNRAIAVLVFSFFLLAAGIYLIVLVSETTTVGSSNHGFGMTCAVITGGIGLTAMIVSSVALYKMDHARDYVYRFLQKLIAKHSGTSLQQAVTSAGHETGQIDFANNIHSTAAAIAPAAPIGVGGGGGFL